MRWGLGLGGALLGILAHFLRSKQRGFLRNLGSNHRRATQGPQSFGAAKVEKLTPKFPGVIHALSIGRTECKAKYRIDNPAMGMPLRVTLTVLTSPSGGVFPAQTYSAQTSWPQVFTLSPATPSETVDFALGTTITVR